MTKRTVAIALCLVATIILFAVGPDRSWVRAGDVRRAHEHEEHPMPDGPAPPFQS